MSKEFEALERLAMPDDIHIKECEKLGIGLTEDYDLLEQYILKAQERENENARYKQLEEQLGCPLEVRERALTNGIYIKNIYGDMVNFKVMLVYKNKELGYYFRIINDGAVLLKDYKKTWFLKEDKSE